MEAQTVRYAEDVIALAKENASEMKLNKESLRRIKFGNDSGFFYLSDNPQALISDKSFEVDGTIFYIGIYKSK